MKKKRKVTVKEHIVPVKRRGRPPKLKVRPIEPVVDVVLNEAVIYAPPFKLCETPGCKNPVAADQPHVCAQHIRSS